MDKVFAKWPIKENVEMFKELNLLKTLIKYSTNIRNQKPYLSLKF